MIFKKTQIVKSTLGTYFALSFNAAVTAMLTDFRIGLEVHS